LFLLRATELMYSICGSGKGTNKEISESDVLVLVRGSQLAKEKEKFTCKLEDHSPVFQFWQFGCIYATRNKDLVQNILLTIFSLISWKFLC
jgi:hypothetical protein